MDSVPEGYRTEILLAPEGVSCLIQFRLTFSQVVLLLLLWLPALALYPTRAAAKDVAALVVRSAPAEAGDSVRIAISLRGIQNLTGIEGLSGGEFEIHYDPTAVNIEKISKGSALGSGLMFFQNINFSESSAKVTIAALNGLITADGDLCNITFTLKKSGSPDIMLDNIAFFDQDVRSLSLEVINELPEGSLPEHSSPSPGGAPADGSSRQRWPAIILPALALIVAGTCYLFYRCSRAK